MRCCIFLFLLRYVIFTCIVENKLIFACSIQIKGIYLYQQLKQQHYERKTIIEKSKRYD